MGKPEKIICAIAVLAVVLFAACSAHDAAVKDASDLAAFNQAMPDRLRQDSMKDVKAIAGDGNYLSTDVEDWIFLWDFAEEYGIDEFPAIEPDGHGTYYANTRKMIGKLHAIDDYAKDNGLGSAEVSVVLNRAFAAENQDYVALLSLG